MILVYEEAGSLRSFNVGASDLVTLIIHTYYKEKRLLNLTRMSLPET